MFVGPDHPIFAGLVPTTFWQLERSSLLHLLSSAFPNDYQPPANGWGAMVAELQQADPTFADRKGRFCRAVKDLIDRSERPTSVRVIDLAAQAGLPVGWCWNAIRGNLFTRVHDAARWGQLQYDDEHVTLPPTWGQRY